MSVYKDLTKVLDQKTTDSFDAKHCAEYLWTWSDINSVNSAKFDILNELEDMDKTSKSREEHDEFCKKNYSKILDKYYKKVKKEANSLLDNGYKNLANYFKNL